MPVPALSGSGFWPPGCWTGLTGSSKSFSTCIQPEMTLTGKQHPRVASCLGAEVSLWDLADPSPAP